MKGTKVNVAYHSSSAGLKSVVVEGLFDVVESRSIFEIQDHVPRRNRKKFKLKSI
jgi:hypothetical protein